MVPSPQPPVPSATAAVATTAHQQAGQRPQFRLHDDGNGIDINPWTIQKREKPIASTADEERLTEQLHIKLPSMFFNESHLQLTYNNNNVQSESQPSKFQLIFNTIDALAMVGEADPNIKVKAAAQWRNNEQRSDVQITTIEQASDWTFTTKYLGTIKEASPTHRIQSAELQHHQHQPSNLTPIDYNLLRDTSLPILFATQLILFEDELDDNGTASYKVRIRVMPNFVFILARFFLRVDAVLIRIYDTRYFHCFNSSHIVRETVHREASIPGTLRHLPVATLRDPDLVAPQVPITFSRLENIYI